MMSFLFAFRAAQTCHPKLLSKSSWLVFNIGFLLCACLLLTASTRVLAQSSPQAVSVAIDSNSHSWLLWNNPDNSASLWNLDASGALIASYHYGPYTDGPSNPTAIWKATAVSIGPNNVVHLLWNNTDNKMLLWNVDSGGGFTTLGAYGPYTDGPGNPNLWSATALATGPDGVLHILWNNQDGKVLLWTVNATGSFTTVAAYGPY